MNLGFYRNVSRETLELIHRGQQLGELEIVALEQRVSENPDDREARLLLLGVDAPGNRRIEHVLWFVRTEPWTSLADHGMRFDGTEADQLRLAWLTAIGEHQDDPRVIENAAWFFAPRDGEFGLQLLKTYAASRSDLRAAAAWEVVALYADFQREVWPRGSVEAATFGRRALDAAFLAFRSDPNQPDRLRLLPTMRACCAAEPGRIETLEQLEHAEDAAKRRSSLEGAAKKQLAILAVGFIALADADPARALTHLGEAMAVAMPTDLLDDLAMRVAALLPEAVVSTMRDHASKVAEAARRLDACIRMIESSARSSKEP